MNRILIIGCGDIAMRIAPLLKSRYHLFGLVRRIERFNELREAGITPLFGDLDDRNSFARIAGLADIVLHFAPPPPGTPSLRPPLATSIQEKSALVDFRTRNLLAILSNGKLPRRIIYISTSGVYGDCGGTEVHETRRLNPQTVRAQRRVSAEAQIRKWSKHNGVKASILRVPGIYAEDRLPLERLRAGIPAIVQNEDSHTNHIHADDLARIIVAALHNGKSNRVYHTSDDSQLKMGNYFDSVADAFRLPRPPRLPREEVKSIVSPMLWSFMNESRRLTNDRMKKELKVRLRYPTVTEALQKIITSY
ncbi:MAG: SDR family oxidoreductase [Nitrosomonadales bacterium]